MKTSFYTILTIAFSISCLFVSCSDDDGDTTRPTIILNAPVEGAVLKIGSDIHFDADFEDNESLAYYTVDIHDNFNGHEHPEQRSAQRETEPFKLHESWTDIAGKKQAKAHHHKIHIPANATPGKYHLMVYCVDGSGNESYVARNIELSPDGDDGHHD